MAGAWCMMHGAGKLVGVTFKGEEYNEIVCKQVGNKRVRYERIGGKIIEASPARPEVQPARPEVQPAKPDGGGFR